MSWNSCHGTGQTQPLFILSSPTLADDISVTQELFAGSKCGKQKERKSYSQAYRNEEEEEEHDKWRERKWEKDLGEYEKQNHPL